jgi:hypothetical protein
MTTARQSKIKFLGSAEAEEGDYECMICYTELSPNSGLAQTACCLKLSCTGCMMKAFYHSLMARDHVFKCPMCRGTIVEIPHELPPIPNYELLELDFAGNLSSRNGSPINEVVDAEIPLETPQWYLHRLDSGNYPSLEFNPAQTQLTEPTITDSTARYTTWSHMHGITHISFFTGAPHTILIRFDTVDRVIRWHYPDWEIAGIWVTPFVYTIAGPINQQQPILVTIISKPIGGGNTRRVIIREVNLDMTVLTSSIYTTNPAPALDHKSNVTFYTNTCELDINYNNGVREIIAV